MIVDASKQASVHPVGGLRQKAYRGVEAPNSSQFMLHHSNVESALRKKGDSLAKVPGQSPGAAAGRAAQELGAELYSEVTDAARARARTYQGRCIVGPVPCSKRGEYRLLTPPYPLGKR